MKRVIRSFSQFFGVVLSGLIASCSEFVSIDPPQTQLITETVFEDWNTARSAMTAIYAQMPLLKVQLQEDAGLYTDELYLNTQSGVSMAAYSNSFDAVQYPPSRIWNGCYQLIYQVNAIIEGCSQSQNLTDVQKNMLTSEAKFTRAFWYFYLTNLFGDVPLLLSTDYKNNSKAARASQVEVSQQIIEDLNDAIIGLTEEYVDANGNPGSTERIRPNRFAAMALLSRVLLYEESYVQSEDMASRIIDNRIMYDTVSLGNAFLKNQKESIFEIPPSANGPMYATQDGWQLIIASNNPRISLSPILMNSFEEDDQRRLQWISSFVSESSEPRLEFPFPYKYKKGQLDNSPDISEHTNVLRVSELYLIRAEARLKQGKIIEALSDLDIIRKRAGIPSLETTSEDDLMKAIFHERQLELFCEWGHRWLDLKRAQNFDELMTQITMNKETSWQPYKRLWPISQTEIDRNPNMTQNSGYFSTKN